MVRVPQAGLVGMSSNVNNKHLFFELLRDAFGNGTFVKATLSKVALSPRWKRVALGAFTDSKGQVLISFDFSDGVQTERKNLSPEEAWESLASLIPDQFKAANVRLTNEELLFELTDRGTFRLKRRACEQVAKAPTTHNREKSYLVPSSAPFLHALGITTSEAEVRRDMYDKFRQINKFIEIIESLVELPKDATSAEDITVTDFGSGKHYLTFALQHYLSTRCEKLTISAVEQRPNLVSLGRHVAASLEVNNIEFIEGTIAESTLTSPTLVVALHACDTATDDALAKAIEHKARYICVAPCCHKYVRKNMRGSENLLAPMLRHGILEERFAESLTDTLRVLALEAAGYDAKLFEFISPEHTAKNTMITASFSGKKNPESLAALTRLKADFGLKDFYLDSLITLKP